MNAQEDNQQGGAQYVPQAIVNQILQNVNIKMLLYNQERNKALAIKAAIASCEDLEPVSDFLCVQLALKDGDDVEAAVRRARHLQTFRQEYDIQDSYEQGIEICQTFLRNHRGHILSIAYNASEGNYVIIYDQARGDIEDVLNNDPTGRNWRTFLAFGWYLYHALSPDLHAAR